MKKGSKRNQKHMMLTPVQAKACVNDLLIHRHWLKAVPIPDRMWRITVRTEVDIDMHTGVLL